MLLADDNEVINTSNKKVIAEILKEKKYEYEIVLLNDGLDIIRFALNLQKHYGLIKFIITDENMDYFNGSEAIKFLRKLEYVKSYKKVQIFSLTCHENNQITNTIFDSGADHVLIKPISKEVIKNFIV